MSCSTRPALPAPILLGAARGILSRSRSSSGSIVLLPGNNKNNSNDNDNDDDVDNNSDNKIGMHARTPKRAFENLSGLGAG